ncbi:TetR/AcrR family transcriptional regulator [Gordonia shandongensis]|uniref:TetR/AcrR family transcriptional regulator n=1 Tax=Gordonia shandongensis TaxID=376351 RepID=UPI00040EF30D|nr:helix-turn-helix domain-containing protein [Gordonia shandongensis]
MADAEHARRLLSLLSAGEEPDPERDRILAVARDQIIAHGYERFSTDRLARDANVSRQTVYRRCGRKVDVFDALIRAEVRASAQRLLPALEIEDEADRFVRLWVEGMVFLQESTLIASLIAHDPEFVSQMWASLNGSTVDVIRAVMASTMSTPDALVITEIVVRIVISFFTQPTDLLPLAGREQIEDFVRSYLLPLHAASARLSPLH